MDSAEDFALYVNEIHSSSSSSKKWQCCKRCDQHHSLQCSITTAVKPKCTFIIMLKVCSTA